MTQPTRPTYSVYDRTERLAHGPMLRTDDVQQARTLASKLHLAWIAQWLPERCATVDFELWQDGKRWNSAGYYEDVEL